VIDVAWHERFTPFDKLAEYDEMFVNLLRNWLSIAIPLGLWTIPDFLAKSFGEPWLRVATQCRGQNRTFNRCVEISRFIYNLLPRQVVSLARLREHSYIARQIPCRCTKLSVRSLLLPLVYCGVKPEAAAPRMKLLASFKRGSVKLSMKL
jgi:hypothetical protein